jgi:hypothetical protein
MKKTYWWRACVMLLALIILAISFVWPCNFKISKCLGGDSILITRTLFHYFLSILVVSFFLFFISDSIFKKWLYFAVIWFFIDILLIIISPTYTGGFINFGPTKELVSIWMGALFVIISIALLIQAKIKEKK